MDTTNDKKPSFFRRYRWLLLILLLLGGGGFYYYQQSGGSIDLMDSFTRYRYVPPSKGAGDTTMVDSLTDIPPVSMADTLPPDTLVAAKVPDSFFGFALPVYDSLPPIYAGDVVVDSVAIADSLARLAITEATDLSDTVVARQTPPVDDQEILTDEAIIVAVPPGNEDIFDGLLPTTYQSPAAEQTFLTNYKSNSISTRGAYKLVAIAGKAFLLQESPEVLEILNTLVDEEAITAITVSDRQGRILYASNPRERGRLIADVYTNLPVTNEAINWMRKDGLTITGIPIFSVGGRLGTVFVVTR